jgi:predicted alpha/beta-fold hydrolase
MPLIEDSSYKAPWIFKNTDLSTIYTACLRPKAKLKFIRERLDTPDGDFIDIDWSKISSKKLAILCHGLEGSTDNAYVTNAALVLNQNAYDTCALNYRGCSGEPNRLLKSYHSGKTEDLDLLINYILPSYEEIYLVGFSVGGNICLKYLGEKAYNLDSKIKASINFSVPVSLESCALELAKPRNFIYMKNFLLKLKEKIRIKESLFPAQITSQNFSRIKNFLDYDESFTAPLNGFNSAKDYWTQSSCASFLAKIKVPSLIINAIDDSFLGEDCYPIECAKKNSNLFLEMPEHGGHLGFTTCNPSNIYWQEERIIEFFESRSC